VRDFNNHNESGMQQQKKNSTALYLLFGVLAFIFCAFYMFMGANAAWSALVGGGASGVGQVYFLLKMRGPKRVLAPKAALRYFYRSEVLKIALTLSLLAVLLSLFSLNLWIVFMTFVVVQCVSSFVPLLYTHSI
jgi:F0F1-type ATP synthase assembly protein I